MVPGPWTPELVAKLRALWPQDLSTLEIGRRLGLNKNQVIGKAHRLQLAPRPACIDLEKARATKTRRSAMSNETTPSPAAPSLRQALKPCPFCGDDTPILHETDWCEPPEFSVHCARCSGSTGGSTDQTIAVTKWNARAALAADDAAGGWRDISTAPRNEDAEYLVHGAFGIVQARVHEGHLCAAWDLDILAEPFAKMWRPLPPAPTSEKKQPKPPTDAKEGG